jgi:hypothetical protein
LALSETHEMTRKSRFAKEPPTICRVMHTRASQTSLSGMVPWLRKPRLTRIAERELSCSPQILRR